MRNLGRCQIEANCSTKSRSRSLCPRNRARNSTESELTASIECRCRTMRTPVMMKQIAGSTEEQSWAFHCLTIDTTSSQLSNTACLQHLPISEYSILFCIMQPMGGPSGGVLLTEGCFVIFGQDVNAPAFLDKNNKRGCAAFT